MIFKNPHKNGRCQECTNRYILSREFADKQFKQEFCSACNGNRCTDIAECAQFNDHEEETE